MPPRTMATTVPRQYPMADDAKIAGDKLKVFISYSRRDAADFADELVAGLELAGFAPFLDRHDIKPGEFQRRQQARGDGV